MRLPLPELTALLVLAGLPQLALCAEKPEELLTRSRAAYPTLHSYSDTGEVIDEFGPKPADVHRHKFKTYFRAPGSSISSSTSTRVPAASASSSGDGGDFQS